MLYHTSDFHQIGCRYAVTKLVASEIALSQYAMIQSQKMQTVPLKFSLTLYISYRFTAFLRSQMMNILASHNDSNLMTLDVTYFVYPMKNIMLLQQTTVKCKTSRRRYWEIQLVSSHSKGIPSSDRAYLLVLYWF